LTNPEYSVPSVVQKLHSWTSRSRYSLPVDRPYGLLRLIDPRVDITRTWITQGRYRQRRGSWCLLSGSACLTGSSGSPHHHQSRPAHRRQSEGCSQRKRHRETVRGCTMMLFPSALSELNTTRLMFTQTITVRSAKAPRREYLVLVCPPNTRLLVPRMRRSASLERSAIPGWVPGLSHPPKVRRNHPRNMWCETIGNSKSKLGAVIGQPRQQSDAQEIHRLKDGFMDAWNNHETKY
jgi:hypothetical protein